MAYPAGSTPINGMAVSSDGALYVTLASGSTIPSPTFTGTSTFSGPIAASAGAAGAPSFYMGGDTTTGIFRPSTATWAFSIGGANSAGYTFNSSQFRYGSGISLGWSSSATDTVNNAADVLMARLAAGSAGMTLGRWSEKQGAAVASANDLTLGSDGNRFQISGTTTINRILNTGWQGGSIIVLHFQGSLTVTNGVASGSNFQLINLAGAANFSATANDQLTLQYDSTAAQWFELCRCVI